MRFLENQRDDRGRTIRVIRSQWNEKSGSMVVWSMDDFLDLAGGRCRRTLKSVGTLKYFDEIGVFRDFLENQRHDRGRTIRVIRSQWIEKRASMVVWSIGRFFGPSRRTVPEDFEIRRDIEIFRRDWSFSRFSRKPARRPRSNHQSNTFAWNEKRGSMVVWSIGRFFGPSGGRCRRTLKSVGTLKYFDEIGVFRDFLENQRDDRGRTIRVIRSQWNEKRGSMVVWSIGRFFGPSRRTVPEDFEIRRDIEIFRRDWSFSPIFSKTSATTAVEPSE